MISRLWVYAVFVLCQLLYSINSFAANQWFLEAGAGAGRSYLPGSTTVDNGAPYPYNNDVYSIQNMSLNLLQFGVGYRMGEEKPFLPFYSVEVNYQHYNNGRINGYVTQYGLSEFTNYRYSMQAASDVFMLAGKWDLAEWHRLLPYLSAGIGASLNHVSNYQETALDNVTPRISPNYAGNTEKNLAFSIGAGLDVILTENYWLTLGYQRLFQYDVKSGSGVDSWSGSKLDFGHAKTDMVFINLSANFPQAFTYRK